MGGGKVAYHQQMRRQYNNDECDLNNNSLIDYFFQWENLNNQLSSKVFFAAWKKISSGFLWKQGFQEVLILKLLVCTLSISCMDIVTLDKQKDIIVYRHKTDRQIVG